jgi:hypothetical protein
MENLESNNKFNAEEGLKTIYEMIQSVKNRIGNNYLYYLIWGYLVLVASLSEYFLITLVKFEHHYLVWPVLMGLGVLISGVMALRQNRNTPKTHIGNVMGYLWGGWLVSLFLFIFFANFREDYGLILPMILVMYGLGVFVSGGVVDFRPLIIGGIISWVTAAVAFFQPHSIQLLLLAFVVVAAYIVPGHMLRRLSINQPA